MKGLTRKFKVERVDPEAQKRHPDCVHFVLDVDHDQHAIPAIMAYADSVEATEPDLAWDLRAMVGRKIQEAFR